MPYILKVSSPFIDYNEYIVIYAAFEHPVDYAVTRYRKT